MAGGIQGAQMPWEPVKDGVERRMVIGGLDLHGHYDLFRGRIGYVPQEAFLFSRSISDNVALGDETAPEARLRASAETAGLGNDLATLPNFPAEIRAPAGTVNGVSSFQVHISDHDITTPGDAPNVLVAMNPAALKADLHRLEQHGLRERLHHAAGGALNDAEDHERGQVRGEAAQHRGDAKRGEAGEEDLAARLTRLVLKKHVQKAGLLLHRFTLIGGRKSYHLFYWLEALDLRGSLIKSAVP